MTMIDDDNAPWPERTKNGHSFVGSDVLIMQMCATAVALRSYAKHKLRYGVSPTELLRRAGAVLGKKYKRNEYEKAAQDLMDRADYLKTQPRKS